MTNSTKQTITMKLSTAVDCMLQLDEPTMYYSEFDIVRRRNYVIVTATPRAAHLMLDDCMSRSTPGGGWDQPVAWYRTARSAARIIRTALNNAN